MASNKVKDILEQNRSLADQMRKYQQQAAQDAYAQGQRGLSEQLRAQRSNMQQNREQLSQQAMMAQRNIQQGATSRGLGSSGIRDLASIQSQMAQGDALRRITGEDAAIQREAMGTRQALSENLRTQMMGTEAQYAEQMLNTDRFGLEREDMDRDTLMQLMEMYAQEDANTALLDQLMQAAFGDIGGYFDAEGNVNTDALEGLAQEPDLLGDKSFNAGESSKGADILNYINPMAWGGSLGALIGDWFRESDDKNKAGYVSPGKMAGSAAGRSWYYLDGERVQLDRDQALQRFTTMFQDKPNVKNGKIKLQINNFGDLRFIANGKTYKTYNKAEKALKPNENK